MNTIFRRLSDRDIRRWEWEPVVVAGSIAFAAMLVLFAFSAFFFGE